MSYYILFNKPTREIQKKKCYKHVSIWRPEKFRTTDAGPKTKTKQKLFDFLTFTHKDEVLM
jgi:hypothetical protein